MLINMTLQYFSSISGSWKSEGSKCQPQGHALPISLNELKKISSYRDIIPGTVLFSNFQKILFISHCLLKVQLPHYDHTVRYFDHEWMITNNNKRSTNTSVPYERSRSTESKRSRHLGSLKEWDNQPKTPEELG